MDATIKAKYLSSDIRNLPVGTRAQFYRMGNKLYIDVRTIRTLPPDLAKWDACMRAYRVWREQVPISPPFYLEHVSTPEGSAYIDALLALPHDWASPTQMGCGA